MNTSDNTIRSNGKWARVSGKRGAWMVACGWEGQFQATRVNKWHIKDGAVIQAQNWLKD